jgi:hypothetical protein
VKGNVTASCRHKLVRDAQQLSAFKASRGVFSLIFAGTKGSVYQTGAPQGSLTGRCMALDLFNARLLNVCCTNFVLKFGIPFQDIFLDIPVHSLPHLLFNFHFHFLSFNLY